VAVSRSRRQAALRDFDRRRTFLAMTEIDRTTFAVRAELADAVRRRITDGTYADFDAFVEEALLSLALEDYTRDRPIDDDHIRRQVHAAMEEYDRDPSTGFTLDEVRARIAGRRAARRQEAA
jgi:Arc/MetJ-type ribon-helix-helix transcriptional regulator